MARVFLTLLAALWATLLFGGSASACPFCPAVKPTLVQRCGSATAAALGEIELLGSNRCKFTPHKWLKGTAPPDTGETIELPAPKGGVAAGLTLAIGIESEDDDEDQPWAWEFVALNELSYAYVARAPGERMPSEQRLRYFAKYLEHADPLIAADAFDEFGHAPFEQVRAAAEALPMGKLRQWLVDPAVLPRRKGFYGLALGMAAGEGDRRLNAALLKEQVLAKDEDLREGLDGLMAGWLLADGRAALAALDERLFAKADAPEGQLRHAIAASRFYFNSGPLQDRPKVVAMFRRLLARPTWAGAALVDLARWQDWEQIDRAIKLYDAAGFTQPDTHRGVAAYLTACPKPEAVAALGELRRKDPAGMADAEAWLQLLGGTK